jgi:flagellar biosynthetic protein FliP
MTSSRALRSVRRLLAVGFAALVVLAPASAHAAPTHAGPAVPGAVPAAVPAAGETAVPTEGETTTPAAGQTVAPTAGSVPGTGQAAGQGPVAPVGPKGPTAPSGGVTVTFDDLTKKPSTPILVLLGLTFLSLVPAILLTCTSFTKILVVLSLTRNALGLQQIPPNQVLAGLALFLSLFIMSPVVKAMNHDGVQPYLHGTKTQTQAFDDGVEPLRDFMLKQTGDKEIALLTEVAHRPAPAKPSDVALTTLIPAFILSELKQAFIIGFMIFIPFLVIDIVVSAGLMSLGMMMMPPVMVSLPFKILLFVLVDGWGLIIKALVHSYGGG